MYEGFGPTSASEYLRDKHGIEASKETVRQWMMRGKAPGSFAIGGHDAPHALSYLGDECGATREWEMSARSIRPRDVTPFGRIAELKRHNFRSRKGPAIANVNH